MSKSAGTFRFKYTELLGKTEIENTLVIETKDVVRSIGRFGESRNPFMTQPHSFRLTLKYIRRIALFTIGTRGDLSYSQ
jgi:hypothetical protein